jgi:hypothetical protein
LFRFADNDSEALTGLAEAIFQGVAEMRVVAMLFGLLLLLPGACALVFAVYSVPEFVRSPSNGDAIPFIMLWAVCFAISAGGIFMIRWALSK